MKKLLTGLLIATNVISYSQTKEFSLSKSVTVGCYNANPLTDMTKKIEVSIQDNKATFTIASLNCKKEFTAQSLGELIPGSTAYYDTKEKKGIILEGNDQISIFTEKDGSFEVGAIGHTDKKVAKTLSLEESQAKYKDSFNNVDKLLAQAKADSEAAKMAANTLPVPNLNLKDEYGVAGLYYFSELVSISSYIKEIDGKSVKAVYMHLDKEDNNILKLYLTETFYDKHYFNGSRMLKAFKSGNLNTLTFMTADNMNNVSALRSSLTKLEDGLYMVDRYYWFATKSGCSEPERRGGTQAELDNKTKRYLLLGKDQKRIEELMNNIPELEKLAGETAVKYCKFSDALEAAEKPMPVASALNTGTLKTEATALTKAWAQGRWAQEVQYSFITGKEWIIVRNSFGVILGRKIAAVAIMKDKDGSCRWEEIALSQDYNGSEYGKTYFSWESTLIIPTDCATAMKYK